MPVITTEELVIPGAVTLASCYQLVTFAQEIGKLRRKHEVNPPETNGPPEFIRGMRAQQNSIEFFPIYMGTYWVSSVYFHPVPTSVVALAYLYGRSRYFHGYIKDAKERLPGFKLSVTCLKAFLAMSLLGLTQTGLLKYASVNLKELIGIDRYIKF